MTPVVLMVYNRPDHTRKTLEALLQNEGIEDTTVYAFADGPKRRASDEDKANIQEVRDLLKDFDSRLDIEIHASEKNKGLSKSVISGVSQVMEKYGKAIIIEDDIVCGKYFLKYINDSLNQFKNEHQVMFVGGYTPPIEIPVEQDAYFLHHASVWGWATWKDRWDKFIKSPDILLEKINQRGLKRKFNFNDSINFYRMLKEHKEGKIDSWAIMWNASILLENGLAIYPKKSLVKNIGFDGTGVHCEAEEPYVVKEVNNEMVDIQKLKIEEIKAVRQAYEDFYTEANKVSLLEKIKYKWKAEIKNFKRKINEDR